MEKNHPDFNIVYVDGEKFTNEIISAIHDNTTTQFHNKYRAADVLLVDDIQFIGGKESTQEEFFHTFNTLYNSGKQIVLASDRAPREIKSLEDRLRTRFEMGLIADIQPPDFETRVAIIRRKADLLGLDMPDDVAEYIANRLKNNIRQLEGAVKKLDAYRKLEGIQPVIGAAQNAIKDILSETQPVPVTVEKILSEVARTYNTTPEALARPFAARQRFFRPQGGHVYCARNYRHEHGGYWQRVWRARPFHRGIRHQRCAKTLSRRQNAARNRGRYHQKYPHLIFHRSFHIQHVFFTEIQAAFFALLFLTSFPRPLPNEKLLFFFWQQAMQHTFHNSTAPTTTTSL